MAIDTEAYDRANF